MDFFENHKDWFPEFFLEIVKIHRLVWIFLWIFCCCVVYKLHSEILPPPAPYLALPLSPRKKEK
jgi:hypothetical protein